jgi:competence protein ComEC
VSGENVAFVLALFGPLLRRLRLGPRWAVTIGVIAFFALITRCEPSVLRASVMAGIAATAFALGRPAPGIRLLALAVSGLVLVDPLLTRSVGFQLSVAASAGILLLSPPLRRWLPGPRWLVDPLAVTIAAQAAVAPLLVSAFGGVPVSSVPANLLAAPAAGLVMTWGLGAGIPGGLLGGRVAALLQWPTAIGISWIATVARLASALPLGQLEASHLWVLGASTAALLLVARVRRVRPAESTPGAVVRSVKAACSVAIVAALLAPALALRATPPRSVAVPGGQLWRGGGGTVLVLAGAPRQAALLEQLREVGVRRIDLVVVSGSPRSGAATVALLDHRWPGGQVWATQTTAVPGAIAPAVGDAATVGTVVVSVIATSPGLAVQVRVGGAPPPTRR